MLSELFEFLRLLKDAFELFTTIMSFIAPFLEDMPLSFGLITILLVMWFCVKVFLNGISKKTHKSYEIPPPPPRSARNENGHIITPPPKIKNEYVERNIGDVTIEQFGKVIYHKPNKDNSASSDEKQIDSN